jgi:hypothetical protein
MLKFCDWIKENVFQEMAIPTIGQARHMGKWEPPVNMIRLVRELQDRLEENGLLQPQETTQIDDIVYQFQASMPKKVADEVQHG